MSDYRFESFITDTVTDGIAHTPTSDDLGYDPRQEEVDELKALLEEWA